MGGEIRTWINPPKPVKPPKPPKEYVRPPHLFDGMIFCGICGRRYGRAITLITEMVEQMVADNTLKTQDQGEYEY